MAEAAAMWGSSYVSSSRSSTPNLSGGARSAEHAEVLACFARGELAAAEARLAATVAARDGAGRSARNYLLLGEARRLAQQPQRALEDFRLALSSRGAAEVAGATHYSRGLCFMAIGEWYAAAESFMQSAPGDAELPAEALVSIGTCSRRLGDHERAQQFFSRALELEPDHAHARMCRAELLETQGEEAKAAEDYQQLLAYEPNFASACECSSSLCVFFF